MITVMIDRGNSLPAQVKRIWSSLIPKDLPPSGYYLHTDTRTRTQSYTLIFPTTHPHSGYYLHTDTLTHVPFNAPVLEHV